MVVLVGSIVKFRDLYLSKRYIGILEDKTMASSKDYLEFILEQLSELDGIMVKLYSMHWRMN